MASHIHVTASISDEVTEAEVYEALRTIGNDQLSKKSPVTAQLREASVATGEDCLDLRVQGHDGEWSKTTQETITRTLAGIDGVDAHSVEVTSGGYDSGEALGGDDTEDEDGEDDSADVETIDGVGAGRAETLRDAGIETVADVIDGGAEALVEAGLSEGVAENIVESA